MFSDSLNNTIWTLRHAIKKDKAKIWKAVIKELSKSRSNRREVNLSRLSKVTTDNDVIIVPGKILGSGEMTHKLTIWCFGVSETAARKITNAGGKLIAIDKLIEKYPNGQGVRLIG